MYLLWIKASFIDKNINKHIMKRSRLCNMFLKTKNDIDRKAYNTQRNIYVSLIRQAKTNFLETLIQMLLLKIKDFEKLKHQF